MKQRKDRKGNITGMGKKFVERMEEGRSSSMAGIANGAAKRTAYKRAVGLPEVRNTQNLERLRTSSLTTQDPGWSCMLAGTSFNSSPVVVLPQVLGHGRLAKFF